MIINVAQQRLIGRLPGKGSSVFSLDPLDLNKAVRIFLFIHILFANVVCVLAVEGLGEEC